MLGLCWSWLGSRPLFLPALVFASRQLYPYATADLELRQGCTLCLSEPCVQKLGSEHASPESPTASKVLRAPTARRYKQARSAARDTRLGRRARYRPEGSIGLSVWRGIREGACELVAA